MLKTCTLPLHTRTYMLQIPWPLRHSLFYNVLLYLKLPFAHQLHLSLLLTWAPRLLRENYLRVRCPKLEPTASFIGLFPLQLLYTCNYIQYENYLLFDVAHFYTTIFSHAKQLYSAVEASSVLCQNISTAII